MPTVTALVNQAAAYASGAIHRLPSLGKAAVVLAAAWLAAALLGRPLTWLLRAVLVVGGVLVAARIAALAP